MAIMLLTVGTGAYKSVVDNRMYRAVSDIAGEVTTQYILRYVSDITAEKAYRNLKVVVDLGSVKVRARRGYYARCRSRRNSPFRRRSD